MTAHVLAPVFGFSQSLTIPPPHALPPSLSVCPASGAVHVAIRAPLFTIRLLRDPDAAPPALPAGIRYSVRSRGPDTADRTRSIPGRSRGTGAGTGAGPGPEQEPRDRGRSGAGPGPEQEPGSDRSRSLAQTGAGTPDLWKVI